MSEREPTNERIGGIVAPDEWWSALIVKAAHMGVTEGYLAWEEIASLVGEYSALQARCEQAEAALARLREALGKTREKRTTLIAEWKAASNAQAPSPQLRLTGIKSEVALIIAGDALAWALLDTARAEEGK